MARPLRVEYPGAHYHVINRGNAGEDIFKGDRDKEKFLEYLAKAKERFAITIHSYCLMTNHYHLLLETPQSNLSVAVQWINVSYATWFNKKHQRQGHLFQGRFKAILVEADEYLQQLSRYIHLNPVCAKMAATPGEYAWSSYPAFTGNVKTPVWLTTDLRQAFGKNKKTAIQNYQRYVEAVDLAALENPDRRVIGGFILGGTDFVAMVTETFLSTREEDKEIPQLKKLKLKTSFETIVKTVCDETGCSEEQIRQKGRKKNQARDLAVYLARNLSGASCKSLGEFFGGVSGAAVTMRYNQFDKKMQRDKTLRDAVARVHRIFNN